MKVEEYMETMTAEEWNELQEEMFRNWQEWQEEAE